MSSKTPAKTPSDRSDRLKSALKANMARRKAQARARSTVKGRDDRGGNDKKDG